MEKNPLFGAVYANVQAVQALPTVMVRSVSEVRHTVSLSIGGDPAPTHSSPRFSPFFKIQLSSDRPIPISPSPHLPMARPSQGPACDPRSPGDASPSPTPGVPGIRSCAAGGPREDCLCTEVSIHGPQNIILLYFMVILWDFMVNSWDFMVNSWDIRV